MKELSIEEKARRYDEAIERAKYNYSTTDSSADIKLIGLIFPELKEYEDEKWIPKEIAKYLKEKGGYRSCWIAWLEKKTEIKQVWSSEGERIRKALIALLKFGLEDGSAIAPGFNETKEQALAWLEKQGKNNMGISEATKQKLEDNLNKALGKETPESWNEFLEKQGEQNYKIIKGKNYFCVKTHNYAGVEWIKDTKYYASDNYTLVNQGCEYYCPEYSKEEHNNLFEEVKYDGCVEKQDEQKTLCDKCKKEQPSHSCQDITELGRCAVEHEQKPADKVEPKFHEGEWVVSPNGVYWHIDKISNNRYEVTSNTGECANWPLNTNIYRSFSIKNAKDGDVLATKDAVFIFKHIDKTGLSLCKSYCEVIGNSKLGFGFDFSINNVYPATKEQRDTLMKAMHDAGYTFDFEKKELKKIEQKPTWSEEDKKMLAQVIDEIEAIKFNSSTLFERNIARDKIDWLKSLRPQNTWKPSEEQIEALEHFVRSIGESGYASPYDNNTKLLYSLLSNLKKLIE